MAVASALAGTSSSNIFLIFFFFNNILTKYS
jgi:hypothetical protein